MEVDISNTNLENSESDDDSVCGDNEINELFLHCPYVHTQPLGLKYILSVSATSEASPYVAAALSDNSCDIFSLNGSQVAKIAQYKEHENKIFDCKYSSETNALLYTGSSDGTIKVWDLRQSKGSVLTFRDTTLNETSPVKSLSSFDISPCNRLLAAGTDLTEGDAFILFWDIRNTKLLGAYWESHTDDITQVKFHPNDGNVLLSGSTDGLINIYNLAESCEEDALQDCLNTEGMVENLEWFNENGHWNIGCITSINDLQLWKVDGAEPYKNFRRDDVAQQVKVKTDNTYLGKAHSVKNSLLVLAGSIKKGGKVLRSTQILSGQMGPAFQFSENDQIVRASCLNENTNLLITGGEKGKLDFWKPDFSVLNFKSSKRK